MNDEEGLTVRRWFVYVPATVMIMFASGLPFTFAVFGSSLEEMNPALVQPFVAGLGVRSFTSALAVLLGSVILDTYPHRLQGFGFLGVLICMAHVLVGIGAEKNIASLLYWGNTVLGWSNGIFYIVGVVHAAAWIPETPGLAMGLCFGALGAGSILGAILMNMLITMLGTVRALYASTAILVLLFSVATMGLRMPPWGWDPRPPSEVNLAAARNDFGKKLGLRIFSHHQVYLMMLIIAAGTGPVFGYYTAFSNAAAKMVGMSASSANFWFAIMNLVVLAGRFGGGYLVDFSSFGRGIFWSGAKNLTVLILTAQTVASFLFKRAIERSDTTLFLIIVGIFFLTFASISTLAAVLARHVFSPMNGGIAFGFSMASSGLATMGFSLFMSHAVENVSELGSQVSHEFEPYILTCSVVSVVGLVAAMAISGCKEALESETESDGTKYGSV